MGPGEEALGARALGRIDRQPDVDRLDSGRRGQGGEGTEVVTAGPIEPQRALDRRVEVSERARRRPWPPTTRAT